MWAATLTSVEKVKGVLIVNVTFADRNETFTDTFKAANPSLEWLQRAVKARLVALAATDDAFAALSAAVGNVIDTSGQVPTEFELERRVFFENYAKLSRLKEAVAKGVILADRSELVDLEALVRTQYRDEYFDGNSI